MFKAVRILSFVGFAVFSFAQTALAEEINLGGNAILTHLNNRIFQQIKPETQHTIKQTFGSNGITNFFVNNQVQTGRWRVENNKYCSNWPPTDHWDCYVVLKDENNLIFLSSQNARYVMVPAQL